MAGANSTSTPKRKHKRKTRETNAEKGRIDENGDASQPLRPPENIHHKPSTWKPRVPSNTFKKGCDDDDAAARSEPRVSPGTRKDRENRASPDALQEGRVAPAGVTASVSAEPTGISPDPRSPALDAPSCSTTLAAHHLTPPRPCKHHRRLTVTNELGTSGTRRAIREREAARQQPRRREPPPPPPADTDRTR
jgi:hypothetical protein